MVIASPPPVTVPPPRSEAPDGGVIEEARRRQRRQRVAAGAVLVALFALVAAMLAGGSGGNARRVGHSSGGGGSVAAPGESSRAAAPPPAALPSISDMGLIGPGAGWAANGVGLYLTFDDGARWRRVPALGGDVVANLGPIASVGRSDIFIADNGRKGYGTCGRPSRPGPTAGGYAIGVVAASTDGGRWWRDSTLPGCAVTFGLSFTSPAIGYALLSTRWPDGGTLDVTDDGARHWQRVGPTPFVGPIDFATRHDGWGVAAPGSTTRPLNLMGALYRTTDGGRNWQRVPICSGARRDAVATICGTPRFFGTRDGVVPVGRIDPTTGSCSFLVDSTTDGGLRWSSHPLPADPGLCAYFSTDNPYSATNGRQRLTVPFSAPTAQDWIVFVGPRLYTTTDGGRNWSRVTPKPTFAAGELAGNGVASNASGALDFASATDGWLIARWSASSSVFDHSTDGGRTWKPLTGR